MNEFVGVGAGKPAVCRGGCTETGGKQARWPAGVISQGYMSVSNRTGLICEQEGKVARERGTSCERLAFIGLI